MAKVAQTKLLLPWEYFDYHDATLDAIGITPITIWQSHIWLNPQNGNNIAFEIQRRLDLPIRQIITQQQSIHCVARYSAC